MNKAKFCWRCLRGGLAKIHLVDKCLILFMLVLLLQSAFSLFFPPTDSPELSHIDIVVRSSAAAIFGYFLSANFIRHAPQGGASTPPAPPLQTPASAPGPAVPQNKIGFAAAGDLGELTPGGAILSAQAPPSGDSPCSRLQIITATVIGLFCLLVLLILRDVTAWFPQAVLPGASSATAAQFRDFVSSCVGFLIGCPTAGHSGSQAG